MKKKYLFGMLCLMLSLTACNSKDVNMVDEGTVNVSDTMDVNINQLDKEGRAYASQHIFEIDSNWDKYIFINDTEVSEDNFYEVISDISHEVIGDNHNILRADGTVAGYIVGNLEKVSFNYSSGTDNVNPEKISCGDSYDKVIEVLGTPGYDGLIDSMFVSYDKEGKQMTIQFEELNGDVKVNNININFK